MVTRRAKTECGCTAVPSANAGTWLPRDRLVEYHEHDRVLHGQQRRDEATQPCISCTDHAVVHVVTEVRNDKREIGKAMRVEVGERQNISHTVAK